MIRRSSCGNLARHDELARHCCHFSAQTPTGIHAIPVDAIAGTVGRCCDFDRYFNAVRPQLRRAVAAVHDAFPDGAVPPINAFLLDDEYFVLDGRKRVATARAAGAVPSTPR
jgi:hypothetical protein